MSRPVAAPWSFFERHLAGPFPFFMDRGGSARTSFAGSAPREQFVIDRRGCARIWRNGAWHVAGADPIECIEAFVDGGRSDAEVCPDWLDGRALPRIVGYLAYELREWIDHSPLEDEGTFGAQRAAGTPLAVLSVYDEIDAWEPGAGRAARVRFEAARRGDSPPRLEPAPVSEWISTTRGQYDRAFDRVRRAIADGEIYQANLSRRAVFATSVAPSETFAELRRVQPVPWGAFLDFGGFALMSNSPECFLERCGERVRTKPIKGTRRRSADPRVDSELVRSLESDPKELAEHLMIVDLERNDLGRVARTGSVRVNHLANVETYATVHHMVSDVEARLLPDMSLARLLRATFPGGSITGAPKLRAMEILREVEEAERGAYTGAIGFFNGTAELELSIAIRTAVASQGRLLYSTGGGIVADSDPGREWDETEVKLTALREALEPSGTRPCRRGDVS